MSIWRGGRGFAVFITVGLLLSTACAPWAGAPRYGSLQRGARRFDFTHNIELFETTNGMKVALIRDPRTNLATVDLRYAVGAAEDPPGRTGLAHLVEHVLFELRPGPGQPTLGDRLAAVTLTNNASTDWDATHYTSTAPIEQLEAVIGLEGERMNATCAQIDEATFARERAVVLAETAERAGASSDLYFQMLTATYGAGHPYARPLTTTEVAQATRDEVCAFIGAHYGPNHAYLVITGPFEVEQIRALVGRTFGPITRHAGTDRVPIAAPRLDGSVTRLTAPIERPTALVFLPHPAWGAPGSVTYRIAAARLTRALARADARHDWISDTTVWQAGGVRAPTLVAAIEVTSADRLSAAADKVFTSAAHMFDDLDRTDAHQLAAGMTLDYVASWDDLPSRGGWIADFMQYTDHNWFMLRELQAVDALDWRRTIANLAANLTRDHARVALITPRAGTTRGAVAAVPAGTHDVEPWRAPVDPGEAARPLTVTAAGLADRVERYQLANGLTVELALDNRSPLLDARLVFPVGRAHEPADQPLVATAAAVLLDYQPAPHMPRGEAEKLYWAVTRGTATATEVSETATTFSARGLSQWGDWHVWYLSWSLAQGSYSQQVMDRVHAEARTLATTEAATVDPDRLAFWSRIFGDGHPYVTPPPPVGAAFLRLNAGDLEAWRRDHYHARSATLIVSGAFDVPAMKREIEELFGAWPSSEPTMLPAIPSPHPATGPSWLADDDRRALQVRLKIGFATTSDPVRDRAARWVLSLMVEDRLRDVRERLGASYGVHVGYDDGAAGSALVIAGNLDEAKAGVALTSILATIAALRVDAAAQPEAFVRARRTALAMALAQTGGAAAIAQQLEDRAADGLAFDIFDRTAGQIAALTPAAVAAVAADDLATAHMVVQLRGRPAAVDAAFAAVGATPERVPQRDEPPPTPTPPPPPTTPTPPPTIAPPTGRRPGPVEPTLPLGTAANRLTVPVEVTEGLRQGDRQIPLDEFLQISGHGDRVDAMNRRRRLRRGLMIGGGAAIAGGVIYVLALGDCPANVGPFDHTNEDCVDANDTKTWYGLAAVVTGVAATVAGHQLERLRPTRPELRTYADSYNRRRRIPTPAVDFGVSELRVAPIVAPTGAGLVVSGSF